MEKRVQNFGVPEVDNTPMGQVGMMGRFYRGMSERQIKSPVVRIVGTLFALFFLVVPGVFGMYMLFTVDYSYLTRGEVLTLAIQGLLGLILLGVGVKIIYNLNFRKSN